MQVWLQRFAWTEQKLAARVKKRDSLPKDPILLRDEPMFCFETAVKLLYWAGFVYEHDEVGVPVLACIYLFVHSFMFQACASNIVKTFALTMRMQTLHAGAPGCVGSHLQPRLDAGHRARWPAVGKHLVYSTQIVCVI